MSSILVHVSGKYFFTVALLLEKALTVLRLLLKCLYNVILSLFGDTSNLDDT